MSEAQPACRTCRFWERNPGVTAAVGQCRCEPPKIAGFPETTAAQWCGAYVLKVSGHGR